MSYKIKDNNLNKAKLSITKLLNNRQTPDNRDKPLNIKRSVKFATPQDRILIDELNYNGYIDNTFNIYIKFNDYEIEEYKQIIKK